MSNIEDKYKSLNDKIDDLFSESKSDLDSMTKEYKGSLENYYNNLRNEYEQLKEHSDIISDEYKPVINIPNNVKIINNISGEEQYPYILGCKLLILPIKDSNICSGDTVLLTAMSFKKTVIITTPSTLAEMYIKDRINGLLVKKTHGELKKLVDMVEKENVNLGELARLSYKKNFSRFVMGKKVGKYIRIDI